MIGQLPRGSHSEFARDGVPRSRAELENRREPLRALLDPTGLDYLGEMLKSQAKIDYQRDYKRRRRAGQMAAKLPREPRPIRTTPPTKHVAYWAAFSRSTARSCVRPDERSSTGSISTPITAWRRLVVATRSISTSGA
jgi:hypothetical protein